MRESSFVIENEVFFSSENNEAVLHQKDDGKEKRLPSTPPSLNSLANLLTVQLTKNLKRQKNNNIK